MDQTVKTDHKRTGRCDQQSHHIRQKTAPYNKQAQKRRRKASEDS